MKSYSDMVEQLEADNWQLTQFERLGVGSIVAFEAITDGVDYHEVEKFLQAHPDCEPNLAIRIVR